MQRRTHSSSSSLQLIQPHSEQISQTSVPTGPMQWVESQQPHSENYGLPNLQETRLKNPKYLMLLLHVGPLLVHEVFSVVYIALCV